MRFLLNAAVRTHEGRVRGNNEDNFYLQGVIREHVEQPEADHTEKAPDESFLMAVADGMGGEEAGELASLLAVRSLRPCPFDQVEETARDSIRRANEAVCREMERLGGGRMGSTLTALYVDDGQALCCNIGDSRCYLLRDGTLTKLSTDHNEAARMVELGVLTPEQAARHRSRHELTQHLGIPAEEMVIEPSFSQPVALRSGDVFLLCSDGLTDMAAETDIAQCLSGNGTPEEKAAELVHMALAGGGRDNVTVLVAQAAEEEEPAEGGFFRKLFRKNP